MVSQPTNQFNACRSHQFCLHWTWKTSHFSHWTSKVSCLPYFTLFFIHLFVSKSTFSDNPRISNIFIKGITNLIYIINIIFLLGYIPISHFRIDPPTQFYDKEILFTKTDNPNEKIIKQYTKSWKTGRKDFETINKLNIRINFRLVLLFFL